LFHTSPLYEYSHTQTSENRRRCKTLTRQKTPKKSCGDEGCDESSTAGDKAVAATEAAMKLRYLIYGLRAKTRVVGKNPDGETSLPIIAAIVPEIMKFP
jgi:hypothetical protein